MPPLGWWSRCDLSFDHLVSTSKQSGDAERPRSARVQDACLMLNHAHGGGGGMTSPLGNGWTRSDPPDFLTLEVVDQALGACNGSHRSGASGPSSWKNQVTNSTSESSSA